MGDDRSAGGSGDRAAAVLGVVVACLVGAGLAVWRTPVLYRSEALIAVPALGPGMDPAARQAMAEVEAGVVASRRTVDLAMVDPTWPGPRAISGHASLTASARPGGAVAVSYVDDDPLTTRQRLDLFVRAYAAIASEQSGRRNARREAALRDELTVLETGLKTATAALLEQAKVDGTLELKAVLDRRLEAVLGLERLIGEVEVRELVDRPNGGATRPAPGTSPAVAALTARLVAERAQLAELERRRMTVDDLVNRRGRLERRRGEVERQIEALAEEQSLGSGAVMLSVAGPALRAEDHRARNAAAGAVGGALAWLALRWAWRAVRVRWRVASGRSRFPMEAPPPPEPRPVVPVEG